MMNLQVMRGLFLLLAVSAFTVVGCGSDSEDDPNSFGEDLGKEMAFNFADQENDGYLTPEEWAGGNYVEANFAAADTNGDGRLDVDEYKAADLTQNDTTGTESTNEGGGIPGEEFGTESSVETEGSDPGTESSTESNTESVCVPDCFAKQCGDDGCGAVCGLCAPGLICTETFACEDETQTCVPSCAGKVCGDDGCGGTCGGCAAGSTCNAATGQCEGGGGELIEGDCNAYITCIQACTEGDQACGDACGTADPAAAQATMNLLACQEQFCANCINGENVDQACLQQCTQDNCPAEIAACFPAEAGSCLDIILCTNSCTTQPCYDECIAGGSTEGASLFNALSQCLSANCGDATDVGACVAQAQQPGGACVDEVTACNNG